MCGENLLNLKYALIDSNHEYSEDELLANDCIRSIILLLDHKGDVPTVLKRLGEIVERFRNLGEGQNRQIIEQFIRHCGNPKISESMVDILRTEGKEVREMVSNLARLWVDDIEEARTKALQEGLQEGRQEGKLEMIRSLAAEGISFDVIAKAAKMPVDKVKQILQSSLLK